MTEKTFSLPHGKVTLIRGPIYTGKTTLGFQLFIKELLENPKETLTPVAIFLTESDNTVFFEKAMEFLHVDAPEHVFKRFVDAGYSIDVFKVDPSIVSIENFLLNEQEESRYKHVYIEEVFSLLENGKLTPEKLSYFAEKVGGVFIIDKMFNDNQIFNADMVRNLTKETNQYGMVLETEHEGLHFSAKVVKSTEDLKGVIVFFSQTTEEVNLKMSWTKTINIPVKLSNMKKLRDIISDIQGKSQ